MTNAYNLSFITMKQPVNFDLNVDQVSKLNAMLPKGYKIISVEENLKRIAQAKKKPKVVYAPTP